MSSFVAFLLVPLVYILVLRESSLKKARIQCFIALTVRQAAILANLYFTRLPGNAGDANRFYSAALDGINWDSLVGTGASFYSNFLAAIFSVSGPSREMAFQSSFVAFGLVLIAVGRFLRFMGYSEKIGLAALLIGLSPSATCYTSSILREGWQQLFLVTTCYSTIKLRNKFSLNSTVVFLGSLILLGCLQKGLALYALLFGMFAFFFLTRRGQARGPMMVIAFSLIFLGGYTRILMGGELELETSSAVVEAFTDGEIVEYALDYRGSLNEARANYADHLTLNSVEGLIWAFPQLVIYYWACPLPWQVAESIDFIAMGEIWVRSFLLIYGFIGYQRARGEEKESLGFLWIMFFTLEIMFAAGTGNWGTAARHRTVGLPILCCLSMSGLVKKREVFGAAETAQGSPSKPPSKISKREQIRRRRRRIRESQREEPVQYSEQRTSS